MYWFHGFVRIPAATTITDQKHSIVTIIFMRSMNSSMISLMQAAMFWSLGMKRITGGPLQGGIEPHKYKGERIEGEKKKKKKKTEGKTFLCSSLCNQKQNNNRRKTGKEAKDDSEKWSMDHPEAVCMLTLLPLRWCGAEMAVHMPVTQRPIRQLKEDATGSQVARRTKPVSVWDE